MFEMFNEDMVVTNAVLQVTDGSCLGNVKSLNISGCPNVTDVSALGNVDELYMMHCPNITTFMSSFRGTLFFLSKAAVVPDLHTIWCKICHY